MSTKTTTKTDRPRALPWGRWNDELERTIAARTTPEQIEAVTQAALRGEYTRAPRIVNGAPTYRDDNGESYIVGYGGDRNYSRPAARPANPISPKQIKFIRDLARERDLSKLVPGLDSSIEGYTTRQASALIERLLALPKLSSSVVEVAPEPVASTRARLDFSIIADGNYAIYEGDAEDDNVKFYRVTTSKTRPGFKNVQVRASDDLHMVYGRAGIAILHRIVEFGLTESQMLFATKLNRCWMCGKSLTVPASRHRGLGPDCAQK